MLRAQNFYEDEKKSIFFYLRWKLSVSLIYDMMHSNNLAGGHRSSGASHTSLQFAKQHGWCGNIADTCTFCADVVFLCVCVGGCLIVNRCYFESFNYDCMTKTEIVFNTYDNTKHEKAFIKRFTYEDVKMLTQNMHTHTCRRELCSQKHFHILSFKIYFY